MIELSWTESNEDTMNQGEIDAGYQGDFLGYYIYKSTDGSEGKTFERYVHGPEGDGYYTGGESVFVGNDPDAVLMVRAARMEITNSSGTYVNHSQGAFGRLDPPTT